MKRSFFLLLIACAVVSTYTSCEDDSSRFETYTVANAVLASKASVRDSVAIEAPTSLDNSGKIYTYQSYIFVNDRDRGIHVIDSRSPSNPQKIAFIRVPGNRDIEVRNDLLYADSFTDLLVFDISDIDNITFLNRYEDAFDGFGFGQAVVEEFADWQEWGNYDPATQFIVGWTYEQRQIEVSPQEEFAIDNVSDSGSSTGQGGSFARFKIVDNYLYAVDFNRIYTFELTGSEALEQQTVDAGWGIETIFNQGDYLYLGSTNGMFIYDISDRVSPAYTGAISHWEGCDPVVVDGDYAYLTLRGGNDCGQDLSVLEVINVADKSNPYIVKSIPMNEPYGLGIKENLLFVSDGAYGMHIYDRSAPEDIERLSVLEDVNVFDVIPLQDRLVAIAGQTLYQYAYTANGLEELSRFEIN